MISRYNAWMDGIALSSINGDLYVRDIISEAVNIVSNAAKPAAGLGAYVSTRSRDALRVTLEFELHIYDPAARQKACIEVVKWANGRELRVSDRPGQILKVICDDPPAISSALRWTDTLAVSFLAYETPYWVDDVPKAVSVNNSSGTLWVPGNVPETLAKAKVDATVTATASVTSVTVTAGDTSITLSGISLSNGDTVVFSHDDNGILSIKKGATSLLDKRTAASSDDLEVPCGKASTFSSTRKCAFSVKGMWL